jgi:hypothetical protein
MDWFYADTGPMPVKAAPSKLNAPLAKSAVSRDGSMSHVIDAVQQRLDEHPEKMRQRRETVEHPFGTIKARMGATHFLMKTLPRVPAEMALHVLGYNLTRVMNIMGIRPLMAAIRHKPNLHKSAPRRQDRQIALLSKRFYTAKTSKQTPAMALGIADRVWTIGELIEAALRAVPPVPTPTPAQRRKSFRVIQGDLFS